MSELQGPRIPGEERSGRRRPLGWIIGGLLALLLLALLIPFACQALGGGGADTQGRGSGGQEKAVAQEADDGRGNGGAGDTEGAENMGAGGTGEDAQAEPAGSDGSQDGKEMGAAAEADGAAGSGAEKGGMAPDERGGAKTGGDLPETGGMSPAALLVVGMVLMLMGSTALSVVVRRSSTNRG
jgi:LPXTG-motif cell wall-anchored protein